MNRFDFPGADIWAQEGTEVTFGGMTAKYLSTPGHTPGSCTIMLDNSILFTGDTLFCQSCGRTDLPGGDWRAMLKSLKRLYDLPSDYQVMPGHESLSTLERERASNFLDSLGKTGIAILFIGVADHVLKHGITSHQCHAFSCPCYCCIEQVAVH